MSSNGMLNDHCKPSNGIGQGHIICKRIATMADDDE